MHAINLNSFYAPFILFIKKSADPDEMHHFGVSLLCKVPQKVQLCFNYHENVDCGIHRINIFNKIEFNSILFSYKIKHKHINQY